MQDAYAFPMAISSSRHLRRQANLQTLIQENGGASALALLVGTPKSHISALVAGTRGVGDALAAKLERKCDKPEGWMDAEHGRPIWGSPATGASKTAAEKARELSIGQAALLLAGALVGEGQAERELLAHHLAYLIRQGPDERIASAIDALTTVAVPLAGLPSAPRDETSHQWVSPVDLDHEVAETLQDLAVASTTMTPTQRRAMVAALQGIKETSWDTTHTPSGRMITPPSEEPGTQPIYRRPGEGVRTARKTK